MVLVAGAALPAFAGATSWVSYTSSYLGYFALAVAGAAAAAG
jgi:hypothetical protein